MPGRRRQQRLKQISLFLNGFVIGYCLTSFFTDIYEPIFLPLLAVAVILGFYLVVVNVLQTQRDLRRMKRIKHALDTRDPAHMRPEDWEEVQIAWARKKLAEHNEGR